MPQHLILYPSKDLNWILAKKVLGTPSPLTYISEGQVICIVVRPHYHLLGYYHGPVNCHVKFSLIS